MVAFYLFCKSQQTHNYNSLFDTFLYFSLKSFFLIYILLQLLFMMVKNEILLETY